MTETTVPVAGPVPVKKKRAWRFKAVAILALIGAGSGVATLILAQESNIAAERAELEDVQSRGPRVEVTTATPGPTERTIRLFSDVRPYREVTLYAKVSGYLKTLPVDKGTMVKQGELIAEVASPETDAQYASATADLANKKTLSERAAKLYDIGGMSKLDAEQAETNYQVAQALVSQLETLRSYERLVAPFDGRVTARYADPGALMQSAANSQTSALPVVTVSDTTQLGSRPMSSSRTRPTSMSATWPKWSTRPIPRAASPRASAAPPANSIPRPAPCSPKSTCPTRRISSSAAASPM